MTTHHTKASEMERTLTPAPGAEKWSDGLYGRYLLLVDGKAEASVSRRISGWFVIPGFQGGAQFNHPAQAARAWWEKNESKLREKRAKRSAAVDRTDAISRAVDGPGGRMTNAQNDWAPPPPPLAANGTGPVVSGFATSWYNLHGLDSSLPGKTWGVRVHGNGSDQLSGRAIEVSSKAGKLSVVTLGARMASFNGGRTSVYHVNRAQR